ncbi:exopolysaccharide Pel transporter PelG [Synoicihabitans lomoniglobus]|uniref:Exopolysaccharide Pel transporter PelG n=1 Tax=Synoicihabitans lomoniglobus TaxID=2909285 RepID=A0AAF0CQD1_9BACT|nr:exopolysaccharide Pel transporter PelG [Opitutaceae bacterium LMO-M01]WED66128.1 exopolysaccharide Pel transporter PelG [Opitutaceae bacterium LMO-M01]
MAGIGFRLIRLLDKQSYTGAMQAYGYAALVGSGPWVLSMMTLGLLGVALRATQAEAELDQFFVAVTHVFAFTLIATGPLQMILSRYAADRAFAREESRVFPSYLGALIVVMGGGGIIGAGFFLGGVPGPLLFRYAAMALVMVVSAIWISTVYISAVKDYGAVVRCFAIGYAVSFGGVWLGGRGFGLSGMMIGFLLGQIVLLMTLFRVIFSEFGARAGPSFEFWGYFMKHRILALCGLVYNLGIWIDKPLHWWLSTDGAQVAGLMWAAPLYDEAVYLSFLSVAPGMAVFLLSVETSFALHYERFFRQVTGKATLSELRASKHAMIGALQDGLTKMLKFQGGVTLLLVLSAEPLLAGLGLGAVQTHIFQMTLVGVFLLVVLLALLTVLFYLDRLKEALVACSLLAVCNAWGTVLALWADERWYGLGFTVGTAVAVVYATHQANHWLSRLDYETFSAQPLYS